MYGANIPIISKIVPPKNWEETITTFTKNTDIWEAKSKKNANYFA
jgi:hypothetical protein